MSVVAIIVGVWVAIGGLALIAMSLLGRAAAAADDAIADDVARVQAWQNGATLGLVAPHPLDVDADGRCASCTENLAGVAPGDPCPGCGTAVTERVRVLAPRQRVLTRQSERRAV
jgi:hypothetical protein